ncbi:hypothetical protein BGX31_004500 [Mortierella sp. GBA43]|nr:hypothetical protein BGX31_004500 [Mortierella sp. GBA43]
MTRKSRSEPSKKKEFDRGDNDDYAESEEDTGEASNAQKLQCDKCEKFFDDKKQLRGPLCRSSLRSNDHNRVMQKIFSKSPTEAETTSRGGFMALESVTSGADVPGSVPAPADFHSNESTPLLRQSRYFNSPVQHHHPVYSTLKRGDSNTRPISTRNSSMVIDVEDEPNGSAFGHVFQTSAGEQGRRTYFCTGAARTIFLEAILGGTDECMWEDEYSAVGG